MLGDVNFDDFDLSNYDKKTIMINDNPDKGTQTDVFNKTPSITGSESIRTTEEAFKEEQDVDDEVIKENEKSQERTEKDHNRRKNHVCLKFMVPCLEKINLKRKRRNEK